MKNKLFKRRDMRKLTVLFLLSVIGFCAEAQTDTLQSKEEAAEEALLTGNYDIAPNFTFSQLTEVNKAGRYSVHGSGLFAGFSNLSSRSLDIGDVENAVLKYSSYEFGWTVFGMDVRLSRNRQGWLFFSGLGFRMQQYNPDLNTAFKIVDNVTEQVDAPNGTVYSSSRLRQWYLHIPIMFEYQMKLPKTNFFVQLGVECGIKLSSQSRVMYRKGNNSSTREKLGSQMNVNPLTVDAKAEIGVGRWGIYARYGLITLFREGRGAEVVPVAAGVIFHF